MIRCLNSTKGSIIEKLWLILQRARAQGEQTLLEARNESQRIIEQAHSDEQRLHYSSETVRRQFLAYITSYRRLLERELDELDVLSAADTRPQMPAEPDVPLRRPA